jgi:hypothetical protein
LAMTHTSAMCEKRTFPYGKIPMLSCDAIWKTKFRWMIITSPR